MKKFKGTPGPWSRSGNAVFNDDGYDIVHLTYGEYTGIKEDEANSNLIAAAPELLEALQACEKILSEIPLTVDLVEDLLFARAAICKALGE